MPPGAAPNCLAGSAGDEWRGRTLLDHRLTCGPIAPGLNTPELCISDITIAPRHGGGIEVDSTEGGGATFIVRLPLLHAGEGDEKA